MNEHPRPKKTVEVAFTAIIDGDHPGDCHVLCPVGAGFCTGTPWCIAFYVRLEKREGRVLRCGECIAAVLAVKRDGVDA